MFLNEIFIYLKLFIEIKSNNKTYYINKSIKYKYLIKVINLFLNSIKKTKIIII